MKKPRRNGRDGHTKQTHERPTVLLGATRAESLGFLKGFPEYLSKLGWNVHVVSSPGTRLNSFSPSDALHTHAIEMRRDPSPVHDAIALVRWVRLLRRINPDIVLVGTPKAGLLAMISGALTGTPARIYHLLGLRLETARGIRRLVLVTAEKLSCHLATRVLSVSRSLTDAAVGAGVARREKFDLIEPGTSNGIDLVYFDTNSVDPKFLTEIRQSLQLTSSHFVVGYVGRLTPDKGLNYLNDAMRVLKTRFTQRDDSRIPVLLAIGALDQKGYQPFELSDVTVHAPGKIDDPRPYYRLMDVLCLPTLREGFPNVPLEAAAMRIPVVTTLATGARDSVQDGVTGLLVPPHDAHALVDALDTFATNPELIQSMGEAGAVWVQRFSRPQIWEQQAIYLRRQYELERDEARHRRSISWFPGRRMGGE